MGATEDAALRDELRRIANSDLGDTQLTAELVQLTQDRASAQAPKSPAANAFAERWLSIGDNWFDEEPPPIDWILTRPGRAEIPGDDCGYLPAGHVGALVAPGGVGKSMALLQLGLSVATGQPWLGHYEVSQPGRVLLAFGEEDAHEVRRRLYRMTQVLLASDASAATKDPVAAAQRRAALQAAIYENVALLPLAGESVAFMEVNRQSGTADRTGAYTNFRELVQAKGPWRMIVLDPLSRFAGPDTETNNAAATQFITAIEQLAGPDFGNPCVMLAHHSNKSSRSRDQQADASNARGSTGLTDGVRWAAELRTHFVEDERTELVELSMTKFNRGAWAPKILLARQAGGVLKFDRHVRASEKESRTKPTKPEPKNGSSPRGPLD
jgi:RecA-family ATPase